jgi:hypothetical protein
LNGTLDLRDRQSPIKDQGRRGTCVACAATAGHEALRGEGIDLSAEFLHWAAKRRDGLPATADGTTLAAAADALAQDGQPPEELWPYDETRDQRAVGYAPPGDCTAIALARRLAGGADLTPSAVAVRHALARDQAVVLGIRLHATWFQLPPDGRVGMPAAGARDFGGHAVLVVGYDADALIVRNSWGPDWGLDGYAYLPDAYVDAFGVVARAWGP